MISAPFNTLKRAMHGKRFAQVALVVCVVIAFVIVLNSFYALPGHSYCYLSRTGWEWGMRVDIEVGAGGQSREMGKSFCAGPFVISHSYDHSIDTNSAFSRTSSIRQQ